MRRILECLKAFFPLNLDSFVSRSVSKFVARTRIDSRSLLPFIGLNRRDCNTKSCEPISGSTLKGLDFRAQMKHW